MKKKLNKKLALNKKTVTNLSADELDSVRAASLARPSCACEETESCSLIYCCPPTTKVEIPKEGLD